MGWSKFVSVYAEEGKKILEKWIFAGSSMRDLFEKLATEGAEFTEKIIDNQIKGSSNLFY